MARTIFATFDSVFSASKAVQELTDNGLSQDRVDILARGAASGSNPADWESTDSQSGAKVKPAALEIRVSGPQAGISIGVGIGAAVGIAAGLLAALGHIPLPAALDPGPLASTAVGMSAAMASMLVGGVTGGALGDLLKLGIPEEELRQYARNVRDDKIVVAVLADWDAVDPVIELLTHHSPLSIEEKPYSRLKSNWIKKDGQAHNVQISRQEHEERR